MQLKNSFFLQYKSYSTNNLQFNDKFIQWFVGFSDAESNFTIHPVYNKDRTRVSRFSFMFNIELHIDDLNILTIIKDMLNVGNIRIDEDKYKCTFTVSNKEGILKLIEIFDKFNLNTTKYLDYLNMKKAFLIYHDRDKSLNEDNEIIDLILELKNGMNKKRVDFTMPKDHNIVITKYWLLGFIEGDGSFFLSRTDFDPMFIIELSDDQLPVLIKIKDYLENNLGFDKYSIFKLQISKIIGISKAKVRIGKPTVTLVIRNIYVLNNYLVPFLNDLEFLTKKGKDFQDFKLICNLIYNGSHNIIEIKNLILKLSYTMNNYRLSSLDSKVEYLSELELSKLMNAKPTIKHLPDGRVMDLLTGELVPNALSCVYEIIKPNGEVIIVTSLKEVLDNIDIGFRTLKKYLDHEVVNSQSDGKNIKGYIVKRIPVFYQKNPELEGEDRGNKL